MLVTCALLDNLPVRVRVCCPVWVSAVACRCAWECTAERPFAIVRSVDKYAPHTLVCPMGCWGLSFACGMCVCVPRRWGSECAILSLIVRHGVFPTSGCASLYLGGRAYLQLQPY